MDSTKTIALLLVEDNPDDYYLTSQLLEEIKTHRFEVIWVKSSRDALDELGKRTYDLYLIDYYLGQDEGINLIPVIRAVDANSAVIILTGRDDPEIDHLALAAGASDYLIKGQTDARTLDRAIRYALEQSRLRYMLYRMAIHDELTSIYNRREFNRLMEDEINRYNRYKRPVALVMMDVDHFKTVNDTYGHPVGDFVLKTIASTIQSNLRSTDKVCRYGGDEFAVVLPETDEDDALKIAQQLYKLIESQRLEDPHTKLNLAVTITLSMGIATVSEKNSTVADLVRTADKALYTAKNNPHTRIVCAKEVTGLR